jgi:peptide/nickel transport system ATP-binding protein
VARDLRVHYVLRGGFLSRMVGRETGEVKAVDGVSFALERGEVLGLVGESGSGKTTLGRALLHLVPVSGGTLDFDGRDVTDLPDREFRVLRRRIQMIFQDPHAALNPAMDIGTAIGHPLAIQGLQLSRHETEDRVRQVMERVGLVPVHNFVRKYPADLSGGQKQRAVIARAIILGPDLLVADEPVSMLDMSVRSKILELMISLRQDLDLTYLYITHDLATAKFFCDRIAIMYLGRIVEIGPAEQIYADPKHPYTQALLRAIPEPDPTRAVPRDLPRGEVPDAVNPPRGCSFHPRCPLAFDRCGWEPRDLLALLEERWTRLGDAVRTAERPVLGDLAGVDVSGSAVRLPAGAGRSGGDVARLLDALRSEDPQEPFWSGVAEVAARDGCAEVTFRDGVDPALTPSGSSEVACLLYPGADRAGAPGSARPVTGPEPPSAPKRV